MQVVIEIPEEVMEYVGNNNCLAVSYCDELAKAIMNGIVLPKGYGDLVDANALCELAKSYQNHAVDANDIMRMPVIIPADKEKINPYEKCKTCGQDKASCCGCPEVLELERQTRRVENVRKYGTKHKKH